MLGKALGVLFVVAFVPRAAEAKGWEEVHQTSDDVRIRVAPDGTALVSHHLRYRVVAGHFMTLDFGGIDPSAELIPESQLLPEKGGSIPAHIEANPKVPGSVRISHEQAGGLGRGVYVIDVSYRLDLVATQRLVRDGSMWRLTWTSPPSLEGRDGARVVFELPSAPTEPRLGSPDLAETTLVTVRRDPDKDELELVRAHLPRGEVGTWPLRVDPKAFPKVTAPELRPRVTPLQAQEPNHVPVVLGVFGLVGLAAALASLLHRKQTFVERACELHAARPLPFLPLPKRLTAVLYGVATALALAAFLWGTPLHGAALVVLAMMLAAHRPALVVVRPRGPGRWRPVADAEVLVPRAPARVPGDVLDLATRRGKLVAFGVAFALGLLSFVLRTRVAGASVAIPLTASALIPLFATGTRAQLPLSAGDLALRILAPARSTLGRLVDLSHADVRCIARFGEGTKTFDEVRLTCTPTEKIPGLRTIELALAGGLTTAPVPELLVRFDDGSAAAAKIAELARGVPIVPGRCPEEKVLRLFPRVPTPAGAARLLARLTLDLEGRRKEDRLADMSAKMRKFRGVERRRASFVAAASAST